jgi:ElaB/YqjD/DUF883 family membrane-anchored ribosome-binding protein
MAAETIKREDVSVNIEALKDDMQKLTDDFRQVLYSIGEKGREKIVESSEKVGSALRTFGQSLKEKFNEARERAGE